MGCISSKGINKSEFSRSQRDRGSSRSSRRFIASSRRDEIVVLDSDVVPNINGSRARLISKGQEHVVAPPKQSPDRGEKKTLQIVDRARTSAGHGRRADFDRDMRVLSMKDAEATRMRITSVPNGFEAEQLAAGWPSWLTAVAGEAIKGWIPRRADCFEKFDKIGQGTYSNVYRARDLENGKFVALKKVRFVNMDPESVRFMAREILILRRLDHPNVVKLEGLVTSRTSGSLYLVFEYMEHDLAGLAATPGIKFTESQVKCYMQQLLRGLDHCHSRGVLHRDIKGSNLLIDNNGILRIADFGLATSFNPNQKQPLTCRVVTLWYRPPELLLGATDYGVAVDLWSAGCILAELLAGKPIMPGRTEVEQLHKIFKLCGSPSEEYWRTSKLPHATIFKPQHPYRRCFGEIYRDFPPSALSLLDSLLATEPEARGTAASALQSEFFSSKPLPCDPSSLPKYPPSKELDAKLRDEEARRQRAAAVKGRGSQSGRRNPRESKAIPMPDANAEMQASLQKRHELANHKSISEKYRSQEEGASGFPIDPYKGPTAANGFARYGPPLHPGVLATSMDKKIQGGEPSVVHGHLSSSMRASMGRHSRTQRSYAGDIGGGDFSNLSGTMAARNSANSRHGHLGVPEHSEKLLEAPSHKRDERTGEKEITTAHGYVGRRSRMHYSGPLMPPGGNIDEMLKEHERQIQQAVRKSRIDKTKNRKAYGEPGQFESLLFPSMNSSSDL